MSGYLIFKTFVVNGGVRELPRPFMESLLTVKLNLCRTWIKIAAFGD